MLITGGAKRVGAAICRRLHAARRQSHAPLPRVRRRSAAAAGRAQPRARRLRRADPGGPPRSQQAAVAGRADACRRSAASTRSSTTRRRSSRRPSATITPEAWDDLIGTNLRAPLFLAQAAAPALRKTQGAIVNIADIHAERPLKNFVVYSIAKAGAGRHDALARPRARARRCASTPSRPGPILWPDDASFDELSRQRIISHTPLQARGRARRHREGRAFPARRRRATSRARRSTSTAAGTSAI